MTVNEKCKIKVIYNTDSSAYEANFIGCYGDFTQICANLADVAAEWISFKGKINDADSNELEYYIKRDRVCSIDCAKVKGM